MCFIVRLIGHVNLTGSAGMRWDMRGVPTWVRPRGLIPCVMGPEVGIYDRAWPTAIVGACGCLALERTIRAWSVPWVQLRAPTDGMRATHIIQVLILR